jgi:photosystem II stability/assembly factor-like uncharacterized protein
LTLNWELRTGTGNISYQDMKKLYIIIVALLMVNGISAQWVQQNSGTTKGLNSVYFTDMNTGYAVGDSGTILKTIDGGSNWEIQSSGITYGIISVHFPSTDFGYAIDGSSILKTANGGMNWISQTAPISNNYHSVFFTDTDTGYIVGGYQQGDSTVIFILKTTNGGTLWSINYSYKELSNSGGLNSIYFTDANTGYAVGYFSNSNPFSNKYRSIILKTSNGGDDWTIDNDVGCALNSVHFPNPDTGYAVGYFYMLGDLIVHGYCILKTTNGGIDWTGDGESCSGYFSGLYSVYFTDANTGYAVGYCTSSLMLKTTDGGTEWTDQDIGLNFLSSVFFTAADTGYAVGANGVILKTTNGGEGVYVGINDQHQTARTVIIYPTPASTIITIETPFKGFLTIHNLGGQELLKKTLSASKTTIDISNLNTGLYIVKVIGGNTVRIGKIIKE